MVEANGFSTDAYLARIGYSGPRDATPEVLAALHVAHLGVIPFENVDVVLGRRIALDLPALEDKLVHRRRGGYCFEQNTLFAAALRRFGFSVTTLEARVRTPPTTSVRPRTHMVLRVDVGGRSLLADVGFGGDGPLEPVDLDGSVAHQAGDAYRVVAEGRARALQLRRDSAWVDLYAFTLDEALPVDYEVANHFTSTHPSSPFVSTLTAQLARPGERRILRNRTYTVRRGGVATAREVDGSELERVLADRFGIELPRGTRLPDPAMR